MNLEQLRALRKSSSTTLNKITSQLQKEESGGFKNDDDRWWKLEGDKAGNGSAIIRFLPAIDPNDVPWAKLYTHGFQGPTGKWYIENCLTTIGEQDPVVEHCNGLWNSGLESDKDTARERKRKLHYICNVLIISDPKHPENEGKVKLFKFGKKIFDMLKDKMQPTFEDQTPVNVFDLWEGANFRLRMRKDGKWSSFDKSEFDGVSAVHDDDEELIKILNQRHDLKEFTDRKQFKSYDELKRKLDLVLNTSGVQSSSQRKAADFVAQKQTNDDPPFTPTKSERAPQREAAEPKAGRTAEPVGEDDDISFFKGLLDD